MFRYFSFILLIISISCSKKPIQTTSNTNGEVKIPINVLIENETSSGNILFVIENKSEGDLLFFNHKNIILEVLENENWRRLRILDCPCGASCAKPAEFIELERNGKYNFRWDKTETWCGKRNEQGIPETKTTIAPKGQYRIGIIYGTTPKNRRTYYQEFTINN